MTCAPLQVEQAYQRLLAHIGLPGSVRGLQELKHFLALAVADEESSEPYLLELAPRLPAWVQQFPPEAGTPFAFRQLMGHLAVLLRRATLEPVRQALREAYTALKRASAVQYAYVGAFEDVCELLGSPDTWERVRAEVEAFDDVFPLERLRAFLEVLRRDEEPLTEDIVRLLQAWEQKRRATAWSLAIPVVEYGLSEDAEGHGALRRLAVAVDGPAAEDDLRLDVAVWGVDSLSSVTDNPVHAARRLLAKTHPPLADRYVRARASFGSAYALHRGQSADLALAALFYCAVLRQGGARSRYEVAPAVACTGDIDRLGRVLPVERRSLERKVRAVFYSWVEVLALPAAQLEEARTYLESLQEQYPQRKLTLLGLNGLDDFVCDRRLARHRCKGRMRYGLQWVWARRTGMAGTLLMLVTALTLGALLVGPLDRRPAQIVYAGTAMVVENVHGQVLDRMEVGRRTIGAANDPHAQPLGALYDVNDDGYDELVWAQAAAQDDRQPAFVACKDLRKGEMLWRWELTPDVAFPGRPEATHVSYDPVEVHVEDADGDGQPDVFVAANHPSHLAGVLIQLSALSGEEQGRYVHDGVLRDLALVDLDGDGRREVLVGGASNSYREGVLAVLDAGAMYGQAPHEPDYAVAGYPLAEVVAYLRFPSTTLDAALPGYHRTGEVLEIRPSSSARHLQVRLYDGWDAELGRCHLTLTLDYDLTPLHVGTSGTMDRVVEDAVRLGYLSKPMDRRYLAAYTESIRYWHDAGWTTTPPVRPGPSMADVDAASNVTSR